MHDTKAETFDGTRNVKMQALAPMKSFDGSVRFLSFVSIFYETAIVIAMNFSDAAIAQIANASSPFNTWYLFGLMILSTI